MNITTGPQDPYARLLHPPGAGNFEDDEMDENIYTEPTDGPRESQDISDSRMPVTYFNKMQNPTNQMLQPQEEIRRQGDVSVGPPVDYMAQKPQGPENLRSQICTLLESLHTRITALEAKNQIIMPRQCKTMI